MYILTINENHFKHPSTLNKHHWGIVSCLGRLLKCDIGKRVYLYHGIYQVENQQQLGKRLKHEIKRINQIMEEIFVATAMRETVNL